MVTEVSEDNITYNFSVEDFCPEDGGDTFLEMLITTYRTALRHISEDYNRYAVRTSR
jgi:hypothetical protein